MAYSRYRRKGRRIRRSYGSRYRKKTSYKKRYTKYRSRPLSSIVRPELKYTDVNGSAVTFPTSGSMSFILLNGMITGTSSQDRLGQRIQLAKLTFHLYVSSPNAVSGVDQTVRVIFFYDRQANGAAPVIADLLAITGSAVVSPLNIGNSRRFLVLADVFKAVPFFGDANWFCNRTIKFPFGDNITEYDNSSNTGGIADIRTGALYMGICCDVSANFPVLTYNTRLRFYDA